MKPDKNKKIAFFVIILALLCLPLYFILRSESMLSDEANIYRFRPFRLIDPHDVMRGNYLIIDFNNQVEMKEGDQAGRGAAINVVVERDSAGYAYFAYATTATPDKSNYFSTQVRGSGWREENSVLFDIPFDKYFINEENAKLAEKLYDIEVRNPETNMYIEVAIADGEALLKDIYVDSIPLNKFMNDLTPSQRDEIEEIYSSGNFRPRLRLRRH